MTTDLFGQQDWQLALQGPLTKMPVRAREDGVDYWLQAGDRQLPLNAMLGRPMRLRHTGRILCQYCGKETRKSFQGFCYEHFTTLAQADSCIMSPEKCHFEQGTCREPEWGERHCFQTHFVYLANTGKAKVGITRGTQVPTRWIDQGAEAAIPVARVRSRYLAGLLEVLFGQHVPDKTNWRQMLKGPAETVDLAALRDQLFAECRDELTDLQNQFGVQALQLIQHANIYTVIYPVTSYPDSIQSLNFDKTDTIEGVLQGIKGQYLIFDTGVINIRRFTGYEVTVDHTEQQD